GEGFDVVRTVDAGIGCSFLMSAEALRTVGLLDEAYFAYHEEVDWCFRARRRIPGRLSAVLARVPPRLAEHGAGREAGCDAAQGRRRPPAAAEPDPAPVEPG